MRIVTGLALACGLGCLCDQTPTNDSSPSACQIENKDYHRWKGVQISNRWVTLTIVPQLGGRLMQVTFGGHDYLWVNEQLKGKYFSPDESAAQKRWFKTVAYAGVIGRPLSVVGISGNLTLTGSFGVFVAGQLEARFYDKDGARIGTKPVQDVLPTELVALQHTVQAPPGTTRVSLHLIDRHGSDRGPLTATVTPQSTRPMPAEVGDGIPFVDVAQPKPGTWPTYHGHLSGNRFSPLDQINAGNVQHLAPKWMFTIRGAPRDLQVTPVVAGGVMYVTSVNEAFALDARSGREMWHYSRPRTPGLAGDAGRSRHLASQGPKRGADVRSSTAAPRRGSLAPMILSRGCCTGPQAIPAPTTTAPSDTATIFTATRCWRSTRIRENSNGIFSSRRMISTTGTRPKRRCSSTPSFAVSAASCCCRETAMASFMCWTD